MKAEEIETLDDLEAWLEKQDTDVLAWFSFRAAARVVPYAWTESRVVSDVYQLSPLVALRELQLAHVASLDKEVLASLSVTIYSIPAHMRSVQNALDALKDLDRGKRLIACLSVFDSLGCLFGELSAERIARRALDVLMEMTIVTGSAEVGIEDAQTLERGASPLLVPLWFDTARTPTWLRAFPREAEDLWSVVVQGIPRLDPAHTEESARGPAVREVPDYHSFWIPWYQGLLDGKPAFPHALLRDIALIDREDWEKGDIHINNLVIPRLMQRHAAANAQRGERIDRDDAGRFFAEPVTGLPADIHQDARGRVEEAVAEFRDRMAGTNSLSILAEQVDRLAETVPRYGNRPLRLYEKLADASHELLARAADNGIEDHVAVQTLLREIERSRRDLRANDPQIEARVRSRIRVGYDELTGSEQQAWLETIKDGANASEPGLKSEMEEDLPLIADPDTPVEIRERAIEREAERTVQMAGFKREDITKAAEDIGKIDKGLTGVWKVIDFIQGWFF